MRNALSNIKMAYLQLFAVFPLRDDDTIKQAASVA